MKLIPKAKPIRIRISSGGEEHSSLETFLNQYDIESMLSLYKSGILIKWLNQIGATDFREKLEKVKINDFDNISDEEYMEFLGIFYPNEADTALNVAHYYESKGAGEMVVKWDELAMSMGNWRAAYELGLIYNHGLYGVQQSYEKAFEYYKLSAENGVVHSYYNLAHMYRLGVGGAEPSIIECTKWLRKGAEAASRGIYIEGRYADIYHDLGAILIDNGEYAEAEKWLRIIISDHSALDTVLGAAFYQLGRLYLSQDENDKRAYECYKEAVNLGGVLSKYCLGFLYEEGKGGVRKDMNQAFYWYKSAADDGYAEAMDEVGTCFYFGEGVGEDKSKATIWLEKAVNGGYEESKYLLAYCYADDSKFVKAYQTMKELADKDNPHAQFVMGEIHETGKWGRGVSKKEAISWYRKAADNGYEEAIEKLKELGA